MTNISLLTFQPGLSTPDQACPRGRLWLWCRGNDNLTISSPGVHQLCDLCDEDSEWHLQYKWKGKVNIAGTIWVHPLAQWNVSPYVNSCKVSKAALVFTFSMLSLEFRPDSQECLCLILMSPNTEYPGDHTPCSNFVPISPLSPSYRSQQQRWALSQFLAFCFRGKLGFFPPPPIPEFWWEVFID